MFSDFEKKKESILILTFSTFKTILSLCVLGKPNHKILLHLIEFPIRIVHRILMAIEFKNIYLHEIHYNGMDSFFNKQQSVHSTLKSKKSFIECSIQSVLDLNIQYPMIMQKTNEKKKIHFLIFHHFHPIFQCINSVFERFVCSNVHVAFYHIFSFFPFFLFLLSFR